MEYSKILSSSLTSSFSIFLHKNDIDSKDEFGSPLEKCKFSKGDMELVFSNIDSLPYGLRPSLHKLLDICMLQLAQTNHYKKTEGLDCTVRFHLDEYIQWSGKNLTVGMKNKMRKKLKDNLLILQNININYEHKKDSLKTAIVDEWNIKNSIVTINFAEDFIKHVNTKQLMLYPDALLHINEVQPAAYYLGRKLATHYSIRLNRFRGTHNIICVNTLLDSLENSIPSIEHVSETNKNYKGKIIKPLESALDKLVEADILSEWHYTKAKHVPLTDEELKQTNMYYYTKRMISFTMKDHPGDTKEASE